MFGFRETPRLSAKIESDREEYYLLVETHQSRSSYKTTIRASLHGKLNEPIFQEFSGTIVTAQQKHKQYIAKALRIMNPPTTN